MGSKLTLGDIAKVKGGKRLPKGSVLQAEPNTHPYIRVRDFGPKTLELTSSYEYVSDNDWQVISPYTVECGDLILTIVGTIGLVAIVGKTLDGANLSENCVKVSGLNEIDSTYLYYYLRSNQGQKEIQKGTVGAVQAKLPIKNIRSMEIDFPDSFKREAIVKILSLFDKKIEFNSRINDYLAA